MFKIECYCDDKKLAKALWMLQTVGVYNVTSVPVVNATKTANGSVRQAAGTMLEALAAYIKANKLKEVQPIDMKRFVEKRGIRTYSNVLRDAVEAGMLRRIGDEYRYRVIEKRKAK
jgi:hypothetical protein